MEEAPRPSHHRSSDERYHSAGGGGILQTMRVVMDGVQTVVHMRHGRVSNVQAAETVVNRRCISFL